LFCWTQVYSQEAYQKWLNETAARERAEKMKRENEALLANSGGHMMPVNVAYGAIEGLGRTLYTLPNAVVENAQKQVCVWLSLRGVRRSVALFLMWLVVSLLFQVVDYAIKEASELAHKEQAGYQDFVKEAHGKWRGLAFLSGGLMIATAMLSGLLNMMGSSLMGFSPFTACVNVYAFVYGVFTLILEYKDKADGTILTVFTGDVKYLIRTQVGCPPPTTGTLRSHSPRLLPSAPHVQLFFLEVPYGRACFYFFVGTLLMAKVGIQPRPTPTPT